ncbi:GAF domain-containing protein [Undibacterium sp. LX40W]|uniref:histidine kinase n=1 Tax=Undibacterium nitidum TaxID=2762298 RepID=A0A923KMP0_9BURK|nr:MULTISPECIES: ATP-binding protein [Undibacterium]MBC3883110.1 GAF domain-containing protein [Undibacterium nitidum]MBC3893392.1 GAF domain-containing protein [Undibacterium sp. LX40W]
MNEALQRIEHCARRHPLLAKVMFERLELRARNANDIKIALNALARRFFIEERLGQAVQLINQLEASLQEAEAHHLPYQAGRLMLCIGRIRYTQGIYKESIRYWTRCIDLCKITHDAEVHIEARIGLGQIYDALGDWETGARFHLDAGKLLEKFDRPYLKSKQAINLGVNSLNIGQIELAKTLFEQARTQAQRGNIKEYIAEAQWHLGIIAHKQGRTELALAEIEQAIRLAKTCGYEWLLGMAANSIGEIYTEQNKYQEAIKVFSDALAHAEYIESRHQKAHCCDALSRLHEKIDEPHKALHYARLHHQFNAEIAELTVVDKFRELREYDLSRKPPVELLLDLSSDSQLEEKSIEDALSHIALSARAILQVDIVVLWLKESEGQRLKCVATAAEISLSIKVGAAIEQSQYLKYFQVVQSLQTPNAAHDIRLHPAATELSEIYTGCELSSILEVSVRIHGEQIGVISFANCKQPRSWSREDVLFGSHIANLIQQVMSHDEYKQAQNKLENRVTERTKELQQQTELLRTAHNNIFILSELGREITSQLNRESIMSTLYHHVIRLMPAEAFSIGIYKPEHDSIDFPCNIVHGNKQLPYHRDMHDPDLLSVWCIKHRREIYINDIREDYIHYIGLEGLDKLTSSEAYRENEERFHPLSFIYAPLIIKGRILGLISVQSSGVHAFERMHVDMLTTLAAYTAVAFDNADTYQQLSSAQQLLMSKEKLAALGALVAGIAHEINTPLGNCLLTSTTLKEQTSRFLTQLEAGTLKRSGLNHFTSALSEANDMLTRNLLTASELVSSFKQVSVDQTSQQRREFNLQKTSQEIIRTMQGRINKQGHTLDIDIPDEIMIDSYPGPYGQVITNFINNALVHGFEGIEHGRMRLSAEVINADYIRIQFTDNGLGIKGEHLRRIFDPFFTTKLGQGGSGLGMNIVHNIVNDLLAGTIEVESEVGHGTRITLVLPTHPDE